VIANGSRKGSNLVETDSERDKVGDESVEESDFLRPEVRSGRNESEVLEFWKGITNATFVMNRTDDHTETKELRESEHGSVQLQGDVTERERRDVCLHGEKRSANNDNALQSRAKSTDSIRRTA
jgi:hypothetical protein